MVGIFYENEREEYLYHNTEKLLKKYRDIVWNIEVATMQVEEDFKKEMDCSIEEFLDMPYKVMDDLKGCKKLIRTILFNESTKRKTYTPSTL